MKTDTQNNRFTTGWFIVTGFIISILMLVINGFFPTEKISWLLPLEIGYLMSFVCFLLISFFEKKGGSNPRVISKSEVYWGQVLGDFWLTFLPSFCLSINAKQAGWHFFISVCILFVGAIAFIVLLTRDMKQIRRIDAN